VCCRCKLAFSTSCAYSRMTYRSLVTSGPGWSCSASAGASNVTEAVAIAVAQAGDHARLQASVLACATMALSAAFVLFCAACLAGQPCSPRSRLAWAVGGSLAAMSLPSVLTWSAVVEIGSSDAHARFLADVRAVERDAELGLCFRSALVQSVPVFPFLFQHSALVIAAAALAARPDAGGSRLGGGSTHVLPSARCKALVRLDAIAAQLAAAIVCVGFAATGIGYAVAPTSETAPGADPIGNLASGRYLREATSPRLGRTIFVTVLTVVTLAWTVRCAAIALCPLVRVRRERLGLPLYLPSGPAAVVIASMAARIVSTTVVAPRPAGAAAEDHTAHVAALLVPAIARLAFVSASDATLARATASLTSMERHLGHFIAWTNHEMRSHLVPAVLFVDGLPGDPESSFAPVELGPEAQASTGTGSVCSRTLSRDAPAGMTPQGAASAIRVPAARSSRRGDRPDTRLGGAGAVSAARSAANSLPSVAGADPADESPSAARGGVASGVLDHRLELEARPAYARASSGAADEGSEQHPRRPHAIACTPTDRSDLAAPAGDGRPPSHPRPETGGWATEVQQSLGRAVSLLTSSLEYFRHLRREAGAAPLAETSELMPQIVRACHNACSGGASLTVTGPAGRVTADLPSVGAAAARLVGNASRHARSSIKVRVSVERSPWLRVAGAERPPAGVEEAAASAGQSSVAWLVVTVADDGPGVSLAAQSSLFRAFAAVSDGSGTTGLGLAMVLRDAERMGGTAGYDGRSFWVAVPVADDGAAARPDVTFSSLRKGAHPRGESANLDSANQGASLPGPCSDLLPSDGREEAPEEDSVPRGSASPPSVHLAEVATRIEQADGSGEAKPSEQPQHGSAPSLGEDLVLALPASTRPGNPLSSAVSGGTREARAARRRLRRPFASPGGARGDVAAVALVVDDNPSIRAALARTLRRAGVSTVGAENGRAAVEALAAMGAAKSRLVGAIVDRDMPVMDGIQLLRALAEPPVGPVPAVMLTGSISDATKAEALAAGALDVVLKPIDADGVGRILALLRSA